MHHAISCHLAQARTADLRHHAGSGIRTVPFPVPPRPLHPLAEPVPPAA